MSTDPSEILKSFQQQLSEPSSETNKDLSQQVKTLISAVEKETERRTILAKARNARKNKSVDVIKEET